jgi:hypothetical protein
MNRVNSSSIVIYQAEDGATRVDVKFDHETVWLTQSQIASLFDCTGDNVSLHLKNIFEAGELDSSTTTENFSVVRQEGERMVNRVLTHYNLDAILSIGYRVNSKNATQFRRWATERLKEYMIKGFTMDDERLKRIGGGGYWSELLNRIRDIRSSEKVLYRQVLDLYATSVDYNPKADSSQAFFKIIQNKLHYAAHGHTAAEVIFERADSEKPFMGLTHFSGDQPVKSDISIAKNYLEEREIKVLNNLVSGYFDFAEIQAINHSPMYMQDYVEHLDRILTATGSKLLDGAGGVSHKQAIDKAEREYRKYQTQTLSSVEEEYFKSIKSVEQAVKQKIKDDE